MPPNSMPNSPKVKSQYGVTLVGGARFGARELQLALDLAPELVAADGGANRLLALGAHPVAVLGDMDSINPAARAAFAAVLHRVPAQDDTDFDKALALIDAPFVLGLGFVGARMDHGLAALAGLLRRPDMPVFLLGGRDVMFLCPPRLTLDLPRGARVSLFPFGAVRGRSVGLQWPIEGLDFAPDRAIGTSNRASGGAVTLEFDAAKMLVILPRLHLPAVLRGFGLPPEPFRAG
ncbi:MAG: thiamine diphosphokinase [Cypionkella sp.]|nr:thiamine diphosphokinase [Cypionkella sp.]